MNLKQALKLIKSKKLSRIKDLKHGFFNSVGGQSKNIYKIISGKSKQQAVELWAKGRVLPINKICGQFEKVYICKDIIKS